MNILEKFNEKADKEKLSPEAITGNNTTENLAEIVANKMETVSEHIAMLTHKLLAKFFNLTLNQIGVLSYLRRIPSSISMGELSKAMKIKMSNLTFITDSLVKEGLIKRYREEEDRRVVRLNLTPKGKQIINHFWNWRMNLWQSIVSEFDKELIDKMIEILDKIIKVLKRRLEETQ